MCVSSPIAKDGTASLSRTCGTTEVRGLLNLVLTPTKLSFLRAHNVSLALSPSPQVQDSRRTTIRMKSHLTLSAYCNKNNFDSYINSKAKFNKQQFATNSNECFIIFGFFVCLEAVLLAELGFRKDLNSFCKDH